MAQINRIGPDPYQQNPMDTIAKALGIASTVYGIKEASAKADALNAESAAKQQSMDNEKNNVLSPKDLADYGKSYKISDQPVAGAIKFNTKAEDGSLKPIYMTPKEPDAQQQYLKKLEILKLEKDLKESGEGKPLPATEASGLGDANASFKALEEIKNLYDKNQDISGPIQGLVSAVKGKFEIGEDGTRFKSYDAQLKLAAQTIGKYLEGGKLTDTDIDRYKAMLPNNYDTPEAAKNKAIVLQNMLAQKQQAQVAALGQAGFNVKNISTSPMQQNPNEIPSSNMSASQNPIQIPGISLQDLLNEKIRRQGIGGAIKGKSK